MINGIAYPSVTEILAAMGLGPRYDGVPEAVLEAARRRGQALHAALQYHAQGILDESSLHPEIAPGFSAYMKFLAETGHKPVASEVEVVHPAWRYCGHLDRIGFHGPARTLLDFKFTDSPALAPAAQQLAGYRLAWNATHPTEPLARCAVLQLKHDGTYRLHDLSKSGWPNAEQVFLAALVVYRAQKEAAHA